MMRRFLILALICLIISVSPVFGRTRASGYRPRQLYQSLDWTYLGVDQGGELGYAAGSAGDVNGDGFADVVIGAPKAQDAISREGLAHVFHGSVGGLDDTPDWTAGGGVLGVEFGAAVAAAGDVNGDGCDDLIVGAPEYKNKQTKVGAAFVYHGSSGGLSLDPDWEYVGSRPSAGLGVSVSTAGDVNGDGYDDVVIGAKYHDDGDLVGGAAFLFLGSEEGLADTPAWTADSGQAGARFGAAVAASDVNGDGYGDVIVGAPGFDAAETDGGAVFLFYGSGGGLSEAPGWQALGGRPGAEFGAAVGAAGDVNGDGCADVVVGAPFYADDQNSGGAAFAFYGSANGLSEAPWWAAYGDQAGAGFGISVASAGDVNGGGYDDVVIGAHLYTEDQSQEGAAFVFRGSAVGLGADHFWMMTGNKAETEFGRASASAGDVDGDGYADLIVGAPDFKLETDPRGKAFLYAGSESPDPPVYRLYLPLTLRASE